MGRETESIESIEVKEIGGRQGSSINALHGVIASYWRSTVDLFDCGDLNGLKCKYAIFRGVLDAAENELSLRMDKLTELYVSQQVTSLRYRKAIIHYRNLVYYRDRSSSGVHNEETAAEAKAQEMFLESQVIEEGVFRLDEQSRRASLDVDTIVEKLCEIESWIQELEARAG